MVPRNTPRADTEEFELHVGQKLFDGISRQVSELASHYMQISASSLGIDEMQSVNKRDHKLNKREVATTPHVKHHVAPHAQAAADQWPSRLS